MLPNIPMHALVYLVLPMHAWYSPHACLVLNPCMRGTRFWHDRTTPLAPMSWLVLPDPPVIMSIIGPRETHDYREFNL